MNWTPICHLSDILPDAGVAAWLGGHQVAIFRLADDQLFAIDNFDPCSGANVLARGIVGDLGGELVVASPVYKQHYRLRDGRCLEDPDKSVRAHEVQNLDGQISVRLGNVEVSRAA